MAEKQNGKLQPYDVQCGDKTEGRISAGSPDEAREMAEEMCQVHEGARGEPKPRA